MTAPNPAMLPGLMITSQSTVTADLQPLAASTLEAPAAAFETSSERSSGYVLTGSLATIALGTVLAGCRSDPAPAPITHESTLPPNQGSCRPGSRDPFCQGYKASVQEMRHEREEGHHTDQSLFLLEGVGIFLAVALPTTIMIVRRNRKIKKLQAALNEIRPPESGDKQRKPGFFRRLFTRTPKAEATQGSPNRPAGSVEDATTGKSDTATKAG